MEEEVNSNSPGVGKVVLKIALMIFTVLLWATAIAIVQRAGSVGVVPVIITSIPFLWGLKRIGKSEGGKQAYNILFLFGLTAMLVVAIVSAVFWR